MASWAARGSRPPLLSWTVACVLATLVGAQYDPLNDFCKRFGHQSAIVDDHLYIDGGFMNWKPYGANSANFSSAPNQFPS
jgi:hypothetical protein